MVAMRHCFYESSSMLVLSTSIGINGLKLDPYIREFIHTYLDIKVLKKGKNIYLVNDDNTKK